MSLLQKVAYWSKGDADYLRNLARAVTIYRRAQHRSIYKLDVKVKARAYLMAYSRFAAFGEQGWFAPSGSSKCERFRKRHFEGSIEFRIISKCRVGGFWVLVWFVSSIRTVPDNL